MKFENNDKIVFAGDSVTDMESAHPVGEGLGNALGFGYVRSLIVCFSVLLSALAFIVFRKIKWF